MSGLLATAITIEGQFLIGMTVMLSMTTGGIQFNPSKVYANAVKAESSRANRFRARGETGPR